MTQDYLAALSELEETPELTVDEVTQRHDSNIKCGIKWDPELKKKLKRKAKPKFKDSYIRKVAYRPFVATNCYADYTFANSKYRIDRIFPDSSSQNRVICVLGIGSKKEFSALIADKMPDLHFNAACQCFPLYPLSETCIGHNKHISRF